MIAGVHPGECRAIVPRLGGWTSGRNLHRRKSWSACLNWFAGPGKSISAVPLIRLFAFGRNAIPEVVRLGAEQNHETLSSAYASALMERALLDAYCRMQEVSVFHALKHGLVKPDFASLDASLKGIELAELLPSRPSNEFLHPTHCGIVRSLAGQRYRSAG